MMETLHKFTMNVQFYEQSKPFYHVFWRYMRWIFTRRAYCGYCQIVTKWKVKIWEPPHPDHPVLGRTTICRRCGTVIDDSYFGHSIQTPHEGQQSD